MRSKEFFDRMVSHILDDYTIERRYFNQKIMEPWLYKLYWEGECIIFEGFRIEYFYLNFRT